MRRWRRDCDPLAPMVDAEISSVARKAVEGWNHLASDLYPYQEKRGEARTLPRGCYGISGGALPVGGYPLPRHA